MGKFFQVLQRAEKSHKLYEQIAKEKSLIEVEPEGNPVVYPIAQKRIHDGRGKTFSSFDLDEDQNAYLKWLILK